METVIPPSRCGSTSMEVCDASFSIHRASHRLSSRRWGLRKYAACWSRHTLIPFINTTGSLTFDSSERVGVYSGSRMMSWPCLLSSAASALSRRQLPQYILAAPAVNARIFIRLVPDRTNCSKTRHVDLNLFILERMAGNSGAGAFACQPTSPIRAATVRAATGVPPRGRERFSPRHGCFVLLALLLLPLAASGQSVRGTVTDAGRKPIEGVAVHLVHQETNRQRNALTGSRGEFTISSLPPGEYRIEAEREGYARQIRQFEALLNQDVTIEISLLPGQRKDTVQVTAVADVLRTGSAALGGVVDNREITGLPLDGRNFYELSLLLPGVAPAAPGSAGSVRGDFAVNITGAREDANQFLLDGVFNGDPKLNGIAVTPPVDAVREFEVAASESDAGFGRNGGGQFNVVLKSGGNRLHGTAYEFLRNRAVDARNFFAPAGQPS